MILPQDTSHLCETSPSEGVIAHWRKIAAREAAQGEPEQQVYACGITDTLNAITPYMRPQAWLPLSPSLTPHLSGWHWIAMANGDVMLGRFAPADGQSPPLFVTETGHKALDDVRYVIPIQKPAAPKKPMITAKESPAECELSGGMDCTDSNRCEICPRWREEQVATQHPTNLRRAHMLGFMLAANWCKRDDIIADVDSPAYLNDQTRDLNDLLSGSATVGASWEIEKSPDGSVRAKAPDGEAWRFEEGADGSNGFIFRLLSSIVDNELPESKEPREEEQKVAKPLPTVHIKCETSFGKVFGATSLNVTRVEGNDDGSITAVTDHWPTRE